MTKTQMKAFTQLILLNPTLEPTDAKDKKKNYQSSILAENLHRKCSHLSGFQTFVPMCKYPTTLVTKQILKCNFFFPNKIFFKVIL